MSTMHTRVFINCMRSAFYPFSCSESCIIQPFHWYLKVPLHAGLRPQLWPPIQSQSAIEDINYSSSPCQRSFSKLLQPHWIEFHCPLICLPRHRLRITASRLPILQLLVRRVAHHPICGGHNFESPDLIFLSSKCRKKCWLATGCRRLEATFSACAPLSS